MRGRVERSSGYIMAALLVPILIVLILGSGMLTLGYYSRLQAGNACSEIAARCAADAGMERALYEINTQISAGTWDEGNLPTGAEAFTESQSSFTYAVAKDASDNYSLASTGTSGRFAKTVSATLKKSGLFDFAVFARESVLLHNSSVVDGFDLPPGQVVRVGTQSTIAGKIDLKNNAYIHGDIAVGVGGNPALVINDHGATITGNTYAMTEEQYLPAVTVPAEILALSSSGTINGNTTISSDKKYNSINLGNSEKITVDGNVRLYITGDITLGNSASIELVDEAANPDANLTLYIGGDFEGKNGSDINNKTQDATKLRIYGLPTCESMIFKNGSDFYGALYAPNADLVLHNSANIYGSIVANSIDQKNSGAFYYDGALQQYDLDDFGVRLILNRWQEP